MKEERLIDELIWEYGARLKGPPRWVRRRFARYGTRGRRSARRVPCLRLPLGGGKAILQAAYPVGSTGCDVRLLPLRSPAT